MPPPSPDFPAHLAAVLMIYLKSFCKMESSLFKSIFIISFFPFTHLLWLISNFWAQTRHHSGNKTGKALEHRDGFWVVTGTLWIVKLTVRLTECIIHVSITTSKGYLTKGHETSKDSKWIGMSSCKVNKQISFKKWRWINKKKLRMTHGP